MDKLYAEWNMSAEARAWMEEVGEDAEMLDELEKRVRTTGELVDYTEVVLKPKAEAEEKREKARRAKARYTGL